MTDDRIPPEVAGLLREHVQTYEQLELLVRIGRHPTGELPIATLMMELNLDKAMGGAVLDGLIAAGVLTIVRDSLGDRVACHPSASAAVARLAEVYKTARLDVMSQMTQNALERVRTAALRIFSSAFLVGRKRDD